MGKPFTYHHITREKIYPECFECRDSEHDDYGKIVGIVVIRDPDTKKICARGKLCDVHVGMRLEDGYFVYKNGRQIT